jgi:hypothetical protein
MKKITTVLILGCSLLAGFQNAHSGVIKLGERDAQVDKAKINLKNKIEGSIEAVFNRINLLKSEIVSRRSSKFAMTEDELKSLALSINSDIGKVKEDINNYATNGDIYASEKDTFLNRLNSMKSLLKSVGIVDKADLDKN